MAYDWLCSKWHYLISGEMCDGFWGRMVTNLNDVPILDDCSQQLFVFRVILLLLQVSCVLDGKVETHTQKKMCLSAHEYGISTLE